MMQVCLDRSAVLAANPSKRQQFSESLKPARAAENYGAATSKLVATFQGEQHFQAIGDVDEATANALNALLDGWGCSIKKPTRSRARSPARSAPALAGCAL